LRVLFTFVLNCEQITYVFLGIFRVKTSILCFGYIIAKPKHE